MTRLGPWVLAAVLLVSLVATTSFALATLRARPLENTEGCLLFEASRLRTGLPLYVDPLRGAFDYGRVPARYHVLYPPFWSALLSLIPARSATTVARAVDAFVWWGTIAWLAVAARRRGRPFAVLFAAYVAGIYTLALYGGSARPDSMAAAVSAIALERSVGARKVGGLEAALFTFAAWLKPNVVGLGAGALVSQLPNSPSAALWAIGLSASIAGSLQIATGGLWWHHLLATTVQPFSWEHWSEQMATRGPYFALPLGFALYAGLRTRNEPGVRLSTSALAASLLWTCVVLAKSGSASCYFMEPCLGAIVVLSHARAPRPGARYAVILAGIAPLQALWSGVASVRSSFESIQRAPVQARLLRDLRDRRQPGELILSDDAGVELMLNDRLVDTPFQTTALVRAGRFPREVWQEDVERPEIVGLVMTSDLLERPIDDPGEIGDRYDAGMRQWLRARFQLERDEAGYFVYRRAPP